MTDRLGKPLSLRERAAIMQHAGGFPMALGAQALGMSTETYKHHLKLAAEKLGSRWSGLSRAITFERHLATEYPTRSERASTRS